ncbi:hypothetical protein RCOM_0590050 [Ricinus communis]|uniref:Uncharacterized protein n=1 Tax=Ricinus communis TaxID=3988 RepID=B9SQH6_RICCO|nr:hypothetical protein RCOM_0590050 [Ricinus communis]
MEFLATTSSSIKPPLLTTNSFTSSSSLTTKNNTSSLLHRVTCMLPNGEPELTSPPEMVSFALAVASAIRKTSNSPIEFVQKMEKSDKSKLVLASLDFHKLCIEQLDLFRRIVDPDAK